MLKTLIRIRYKDIEDEFKKLDRGSHGELTPDRLYDLFKRTGYVESDEFDHILIELCPSVNQEDLDTLKHRFRSENDSRINYIRFLKCYAPIPELIGLVDESNRNPLPTIHEKSPRVASDRSVLSQVCNKFRRKLSDSYKSLRRAFKQRDPTNNGSLNWISSNTNLTGFI